MSKLQGVPDTQFIPLAARIYVSKRFADYFYDEAALSLEKYIPDEAIQKNSSEYSFLASVARCYNLDAITREFIAAHKSCNIINLGAGLETAYFRLKVQSALFYEIDLDDVIANRRLLLGEHPNEILIGADIFNTEWAKGIQSSLPTLFIASGVFQYFHEEKITAFIRELKAAFPHSELVFDAANESGLKYANRYVEKTGNTAAVMHFFVNDCAAFAQKCGTTLIESRPFFTDARAVLAGRLKIYTRIAMKIVDISGRAVLIHLKL
jgi:O-methyltransferase involved in polyketide biosynthesis